MSARPVLSPGGSTPYDGLYVEARPESSIFFKLYCEREGISLVEVSIKGEGNLSFGSVKGPKRANR